MISLLFLPEQSAMQYVVSCRGSIGGKPVGLVVGVLVGDAVAEVKEQEGDGRNAMQCWSVDGRRRDR